MTVVGCGRRPWKGVLDVIDTRTGTIVERWQAPSLTYDVAYDPLTGHVWAAAEQDTTWGPPGRKGAAAVELARDAKPIFHYALHPLQNAEGTPQGDVTFSLDRSWWNPNGDVALDAVHRRLAISSPASPEIALIDIDTGARVWSGFSDFQWHSVGFDVGRFVGYAAGAGEVVAFRPSDGALTAVDLEPDRDTLELALSPTDDELYTFNGFSFIPDPELGFWDLVSRYDIATATLTSSYKIYFGFRGALFAGMAVSPDGARLYVANPAYAGSGYFDGSAVDPGYVVLDLRTGNQRTVHDAAAPQGFAISPDGKTVYVSEYQCSRIRAFDAETDDLLYDVPLDGQATGMSLDPTGGRLYVAAVDPRSPLGTAWSSREQPLPPCPPPVHAADPIPTPAAGL